MREISSKLNATTIQKSVSETIIKVEEWSDTLLKIHNECIATSADVLMFFMLTLFEWFYQ